MESIFTSKKFKKNYKYNIRKALDKASNDNEVKEILRYYFENGNEDSEEEYEEESDYGEDEVVDNEVFIL